MEFSTSSDMVIVGAVLSITSVALGLFLVHLLSQTRKDVLLQRLPPNYLLNLHCCRRPICCSTLLQHHLLVPLVHLPLNVLQVYSISITQNFICIVGPKSLLHSTSPNKAQGLNVIRHIPESLSTQCTSISRHRLWLIHACTYKTK